MNDIATVWDLRGDDTRRLTKIEHTHLGRIFSRRMLHRTDNYVPGKELPDAMRVLFGEQVENLFLIQVMLVKLRQCDPTVAISPYVVLAASLLCDRPGTAVIMAYSIYRRSVGPGNFSLADFLSHCAAHGVPSEGALEAIWDSQKDPNAPLGNRLDIAETWTSATLAS